jgi:hypothetical protein
MSMKKQLIEMRRYVEAKCPDELIRHKLALLLVYKSGGRRYVTTTMMMIASCLYALATSWENRCNPSKAGYKEYLAHNNEDR